MNDERRQSMKDILKKVFARIDKKVKMTTRGAITLSVFLHIAMGLAVAGIYGNNLTSLIETNQEDQIEFELVDLDKMSTLTSDNQNQSSDSQARSSANKAGKLRGLKSSTSKKIVSENAAVNKRSAMLASLASLTELREAFTFVTQEIASDSIGTFTPIQGTAPDTKVIADGLLNGNGYGGRNGIISLGGGNGSCPPRPRPRP
ncbi:MAG: hypothetical protein ACE5G1_05840 [bacterium]